MMKHFQLAIWRPVSLQREVMVPGLVDRNQPLTYPAGEPAFFEQIYCWRPQEEVWNSIESAEVQRDLSKKLISQFASALSPEQRSISALEEIVDRLRETITAGQTDWADCTQTIDDDENRVLRANGIMALHNHLEWVCLLFKTVPDANVTVR